MLFCHATNPACITGGIRVVVFFCGGGGCMTVTIIQAYARPLDQQSIIRTVVSLQTRMT